jgi:hypothetical protein
MFSPNYVDLGSIEIEEGEDMCWKAESSREILTI